MRHRRLLRRCCALSDLLNLGDVEIENCFADFHVGLIHPRNDKTMSSELRNRKPAKSENRAQSFLLNGTGDLAISNESLFAIWS